MTVTIEQAQTTLGELIDQLAQGEEIIITRNSRPVAKLMAERGEENLPPRVPGLMKGQLTILVEDDEHLRDFAEYM